MNYTCFSDVCNVSSTATGEPLGGHQVWEVVLIVLITGPLSLVTIVGNLLVVVSFRVNPQLRTTSNYYLLSLAVADLILGAVSMNLYTAYMIMGRWMLGPVACDIWLAVDYVASNASVMNLLVISFDRYFSIRRPLTYRAKRTPRRAGLLIAMAWTVSFILWGPAILFWPYMVGRPVEEGADQACSVPFFKVKLLTFGTAIAAFYLPVCIMAILYWRIYWEIENRSKGLAMLLGQAGGKWTPNRAAGEQRTAYPDSLQGSLRTANGTMTSGRRSQKEVGCFPRNVRVNQLSRARSASDMLELASPRRNGSFQEGDSRNSWSGDNEEEDEDDGVVSTSTEEELEQEVKAPNATGSIRLSPPPNGSAADGSREIKISPRASCMTGSIPPRTKPPSDRSSQNGAQCDPSPQGSVATSTQHQQKGKRRRNMIIHEKKAARTLSAILLAFILTWTPYNVMVLVNMSYSVPDELWHLGYWLCYVNSTVNPMCYALCNESFRRTFKSLLMCRSSQRNTWTPRGLRASAMQSCSTV